MNQDEEPRFEKISEDDRGANYRVLLPNGQELVLIFSKAGAVRGGHWHEGIEVDGHKIDAREVAMLLTGKLKTMKASAPGAEMTSRIIEPGEIYRNSPGEPHVGEFLEESWLLDWKVVAKAGEFKTINYPPMRKLVEEGRK